ncbi:MAG: 4'-phosphopantetheinyl transferase superfamily protein [Paludibacter sp.]|jgi:phosphopantetheinyl transferase|nr:4'-phosphopantetheinyl transferase superfamily protein [Paludibacter sp.]
MIERRFISVESEILVWKIEETIEELLKQFSDFSFYKSDYAKINSDKHRFQFLASRLALKILLNGDAFVVYDQNGKPSLKDDTRNISISHSGDYVAIIVNSTHAVGIDIEMKSERFARLYQRYLSQIEQAELFDKSDLTKVQLAWSAKETLYKILGGESGEFVENLRILPFVPAHSGNIAAIYNPTNKHFLLNYITTDNYNLVWMEE